MIITYNNLFHFCSFFSLSIRYTVALLRVFIYLGVCLFCYYYYYILIFIIYHQICNYCSYFTYISQCLCKTDQRVSHGLIYRIYVSTEKKICTRVSHIKKRLFFLQKKTLSNVLILVLINIYMYVIKKM